MRGGRENDGSVSCSGGSLGLVVFDEGRAETFFALCVYARSYRLEVLDRGKDREELRYGQNWSGLYFAG